MPIFIEPYRFENLFPYMGIVALIIIYNIEHEILSIMNDQ